MRAPEISHARAAAPAAVDGVRYCAELTGNQTAAKRSALISNRVKAPVNILTQVRAKKIRQSTAPNTQRRSSAVVIIIGIPTRMLMIMTTALLRR